MVVSDSRIVVDDVIPCPRETAVVCQVRRIRCQTCVIEVAGIRILVTLEIALTVVGIAR